LLILSEPSRSCAPFASSPCKKQLDRPKINHTMEKRIQAQLRARKGMLAIAWDLKVGAGTEASEATSHTTAQHAFDSTVSVGVAISDEERSNLNSLLNAADQALYRARALGRNRVEISLYLAERSTTERAITI
jgi:GGDEF domain-containing protein